jgi:hypothetical protein
LIWELLKLLINSYLKLYSLKFKILARVMPVVKRKTREY